MGLFAIFMAQSSSCTLPAASAGRKLISRLRDECHDQFLSHVLLAYAETCALSLSYDRRREERLPTY